MRTLLAIVMLAATGCASMAPPFRVYGNGGTFRGWVERDRIEATLVTRSENRAPDTFGTRWVTRRSSR